MHAAEHPRPNPPGRYTTIKLFSEMYSVSIHTVHRWIKQGMPCFKKGRIVRVDAIAASEWLRTDEIEREAVAAAVKIAQ